MKRTLRFFVLTSLLFLQLEILAQNVTVDSAVIMKSSVDNTTICPDKKEAYLYVDLTASGAFKRIPLNISIVLDRSGSMAEEERLHNAKIALCYLIDHLNPDDICSIVIYDHLAEVIHGATTVTDKEHLKRKIHRITPGGRTNISMGLQLGYQEVKMNYSADKINRVILLSDGLANEGITDDYLLEMIVRNHSQKENISLSSFGMGHEFNEKLMHNLAEYGGGNYYFIERASEAINDFGTEIKILLGVVAQNGILKIKYPGDALKISHVFGFPYTSFANEIMVDLKEIHPNEAHGLLIKFYIAPPVPDSILFTTTLQYLNTLSNKPILKSQNIILKKSIDNQDCINGIQADVLDKVIFYSSNYYLDSAADHAEKGDFEIAHSTLESAKQLHQSSSKGATSTALNQQYQLIEEYQSQLIAHKSAHPDKLKILHKRIRHKNYKLRKGKCPK